MAAKSFYDVVRAAPKLRFKGIERNYTVEDVLKLRGSWPVETAVATVAANKLWHLLNTEPYIHSLGAYTGGQAVQMVRAGLKAIYLSGWQVAADANSAGQMYPDQSLYPANSGPALAERINAALKRADEIEAVENGGVAHRDWLAPIVADAEAGFGGSLNCFELARSYIKAGVGGIHLEDQLGSEKKCGHMGGKVLIPTSEHVRHLNACRLAADVAGVPTVFIARTDAESALLLTNDIDERDHQFIDHQAGRTAEGFFRLKKGSGLAHCIQRGLAFAPYSDLLWMETSTPNLQVAKEFAEGVRKQFPDKMLAYNCSPSFKWSSAMSPAEAEQFQRELGAMGYKYQFVTLAGFHVNNYGSFELARHYRDRGMGAYMQLQESEFAAEKAGYTAVKHQREVGTGFFDAVSNAVAGGQASTTALQGSTETAQFYADEKAGPDERVAVTA